MAKKLNFKKYISDGLLIVFSVLFALSINKIADNYQTKQRKKIALKSIKKELYKNFEIIKNWNTKHLEINKRVNNIISGKNDSLKKELLKYNFLNFGILTNNENLINSLLTNTAWETAKTTGVIAEFDFKTTEQLTYVYAMQEIISERTIVKLLDFLFDKETHKIENIEITLMQFQLRFGELVGQEYVLKQLYTDAIKDFE